MERVNIQSNSSREQHWGNHISCWRKSGLTQRQYCLSHGIAISTFSYWKRRSDKGSVNKSSTLFYPLTVKPISTSAKRKEFHTEIRLSLCNDKFKIELENDFSESTLKRLITTLETV